jgi:hypothetical protein
MHTFLSLQASLSPNLSLSRDCLHLHGAVVQKSGIWHAVCLL